MSPDPHILTGAYALDALDADELASFERHLATCEVCRHELDGFAATAALLGSAAAEPAPPALRARLADLVDVTRQLPPVRRPGRPRLGLRRRLRRVLAAVAAVLAVALMALGGAAARLQGRVADLEAQVDDLSGDAGLAGVLAAPDLRQIALQGADANVRLLWSPGQDRGVLVADGLPALPPSRAYELWLYHQGTPRPALLFVPDRDGTVAAEVTAPLRGAELVALTVGPRSGSSRPSGDLVARAPL